MSFSYEGALLGMFDMKDLQIVESPWLVLAVDYKSLG